MRVATVYPIPADRARVNRTAQPASKAERPARNPVSPESDLEDGVLSW